VVLLLLFLEGINPVAPDVGHLSTTAVSASSSYGFWGRSAHSGQTVTVVPETAGTRSGCADASLVNPYPQAVEGNLAFNGNLFNLPGGALGGSSLCYDARTGTLSDKTGFTALPGAAQHGVLGYPEAILGQNIYGGMTGSIPGALPLPNDRLSNLTSRGVWAHLDYSLTAPGQSPYDFAFDDWFTQYEANSGSTGNVGNRIEVMIWLSNDIGMYRPQTQVTIPSYLNGHPNPGTWYRDTVCQSSSFLTFDYLFAPSGSKPGYGVTSGRVAFDLTDILQDVESVIHAGTCWASPGTNVGGYWADNFPLGAEFYPTPGDTASVDWSVSSLYYRVF
jgi:hypothetical protein